MKDRVKKKVSTLKKLLLLLATALVALSFAGCTKIEDSLNEQMMKKSGVSEEEAYLEYQQYSEDGLLDADGYYADAEMEETAPIQVTFSENNNLDIKYYSDKNHRNAVNSTNCYLNPGDAVYAVVEVNDGAFSSMYSFSEFRIYEYDSDGNRFLSDILTMEKQKEDYVLKIPESYVGTDISVEPVGSYSVRTIKLRDYYTDDNDKENELPGTWIINDKEYTSNDAEISPIESYIISYEFDPDEYFYVSSSPECFYSNNLYGEVIFSQREPEDETEEYSVELHKCFSVTLVSDQNRTVSVNGGESQSVQANGELVINHLKYGDAVTIETDTSWEDLENIKDLILTGAERFSENTEENPYEYKYTLSVPEKDGEFVFDPADYSYEHGEISFRCFGKTVTTKQLLARGNRIYYEQASAEDGYWLSGDASSHYITVGNEEETKAALEAIHFTPKVSVTVELPQPVAGGRIIYKINGSKVDGTSVSTYSGTEISVRFIPWEGWISSVTGEAVYTVGDSIRQSVEIDGKDVDSVLYEDPEHQPELTLKLEKSVGEAMEFTLTASGFEMSTETYGKEGFLSGFSNKETLIDKQKIGTEEPIRITMANRAVQAGTAVKMSITFTENNGEEKTEIRYIDDISKALDPIYIYEPGTNETAATWYKAIDITISVVDIERFSVPEADENSEISVAVVSTGEILHSGDMIEGNTKVRVTITPDSGYYIAGKDKVTNGVYCDTMKFLDYLENIGEILSEHPVAEYYLITLDESDSFAEYTYKLDGEEVSGTIYAGEGQKLQLQYKVAVQSGKTGAKTNKKSSESTIKESIIISADMDGTVITKADFGIETK